MGVVRGAGISLIHFYNFYVNMFCNSAVEFASSLTFLSLSRVRGEERVTNLRTSAWERLLLNLPLLVGGMPFSVKFNWKLIKCKCTISHTLVFVFDFIQWFPFGRFCSKGIGSLRNHNGDGEENVD